MTEAQKKLLWEAVAELTAYIDDSHKYRDDYASESRKWVRDMQLVWDLEEMLREADGA